MMQGGYATVCPKMIWYDVQRYLVAAAAQFLIPAIMTGTVFFLLWLGWRRLRRTA